MRKISPLDVGSVGFVDHQLRGERVKLGTSVRESIDEVLAAKVPPTAAVLAALSARETYPVATAHLVRTLRNAIGATSQKFDPLPMLLAPRSACSFLVVAALGFLVIRHGSQRLEPMTVGYLQRRALAPNKLAAARARSVLAFVGEAFAWSSACKGARAASLLRSLALRMRERSG